MSDDEAPLIFRQMMEETGSAEARDLERLRVIVSEMLHENAAQLVAVMWQIRGVVTGRPAVASAFACLCVAETLLMNSGLEISDPTFAVFRAFAVNLAERVQPAAK